LTDVSARFCKTCGFGFEQTGAAAQESTPVSAAAPNQGSLYAAPAERGNRSTLLAIVIAVVAGLVVGGVLCYRIIVGTRGQSSVAKQNKAAAVSAVHPEAAPSTVKPPPQIEALSIKSPDTLPPAASVSKRENKQAVVPISSVDTPPVLIDNTPKPQAIPAPIPPPPEPSITENAPAANPVRPRAVQETEAESSPVAPSSPPANTAPIPEPVPKPVYEGPMNGIATWTGRLEKNGTLTITGGTASTGNLSGSGLPGIPVRVTIEQTNLGFVEMPNAANGYRRLVLKSHSNHDKITIHWTVVQ
jgi:hypothetical protein